MEIMSTCHAIPETDRVDEETMYVSLRPPTDRRLPGGTALLLLGPPGSGKSTLSKELAFRHNARVFRLREYAQERAYTDPVLAAAIRERSDAWGWLPDRMALSLVEDAVTGLFGPSERGPVIFEGYPGNALQTDRLMRLLQHRYASPIALVLRLHPEVARQRARQRRVCPQCDPEFGEPHRPARLSTAGRCAECGGLVLPRSGDSPERLAARTERYHQQLPLICRVLCAWGVPWHILDADRTPEQLLATAEVALTAHLREPT
jgi:adenylate kinase